MTTNHDFRFIVKDDHPAFCFNFIEKNMNFRKLNSQNKVMCGNEYTIYMSIPHFFVELKKFYEFSFFINMYRQRVLFNRLLNISLSLSACVSKKNLNHDLLLLFKLVNALNNCFFCYEEKNIVWMSEFFSKAVNYLFKIFNFEFVHDCHAISLDECANQESNLNGNNLKKLAVRLCHPRAGGDPLVLSRDSALLGWSTACAGMTKCLSGVVGLQRRLLGFAKSALPNLHVIHPAFLNFNFCLGNNLFYFVASMCHQLISVSSFRDLSAQTKSCCVTKSVTDLVSQTRRMNTNSHSTDEFPPLKKEGKGGFVKKVFNKLFYTNPPWPSFFKGGNSSIKFRFEFMEAAHAIMEDCFIDEAYLSSFLKKQNKQLHCLVTHNQVDSIHQQDLIFFLLYLLNVSIKNKNNNLKSKQFYFAVNNKIECKKDLCAHNDLNSNFISSNAVTNKFTQSAFDYKVGVLGATTIKEQNEQFNLDENNYFAVDAAYHYSAEKILMNCFLHALLNANKYFQNILDLNLQSCRVDRAQRVHRAAPARWIRSSVDTLRSVHPAKTSKIIPKKLSKKIFLKLFSPQFFLNLFSINKKSEKNSNLNKKHRYTKRG